MSKVVKKKLKDVMESTKIRSKEDVLENEDLLNNTNQIENQSISKPIVSCSFSLINFWHMRLKV